MGDLIILRLFITFFGGIMANDVYVQVNTKKLKEMSDKLRNIMEPTAAYDSKHETFLKNIIGRQRESAANLYDMVFNIKNGQAD